MIKNPDLHSSYYDNKLGEDIYNFVIKEKPKKIIEFGCLFGYSSYFICQAIKELNYKIDFLVYDLFDDYDYNKCSMLNFFSNMGMYRCDKYITGIQKKSFEDFLSGSEKFDLMHLDISNDGDKLMYLYNYVKNNKFNAKIIFEGGSEERDNIDWMKKYNKKPINDVKKIVNYKIINNKFPSISYMEINGAV